VSTSERRSGTPTIIGGLLLAAVSMVAASAIDPAADGIAGVLRVWAIGGVVVGLVVALMGALPSAPRDAALGPRPRLRGLVLAGTAALVVTMKVAVGRESSWLTVLSGTVLLAVGLADFAAERRRVRTAAGPD